MNRTIKHRNGALALAAALVVAVAPLAPTSPAHAAPPVLLTRSPGHRATGVAIDANLELTFDQAVSLDGGNITIKKLVGSNWVITEVLRAQDGLAVTTFVPGTFKVIINPRTNFEYSTTYAILIDGWYFKNTAGEALPEFSSEGSWQFSTVAAPSPTTTTTTVAPTTTVLLPRAVVGTSCPRTGATRTVRATRLVCRASGGKTIWRRG
jgi:methionine-rich copper-binding protein CopC